MIRFIPEGATVATADRMQVVCGNTGEGEPAGPMSRMFWTFAVNETEQVSTRKANDQLIHSHAGF